MGSEKRVRQLTALEARSVTSKTVDTWRPAAGSGRLLIIPKARKSGDVQREFYFRYFAHGRERAIKLGLLGESKQDDDGLLSLEEARAKAAQQAALLKDGNDPQLHAKIEKADNARKQRETKQQIEDARRRGTLADLCDSYARHLAVQGKPTARDVERTFQLHVLKPFPALAVTAAKEITPDDVSDIIAKMIANNITRRSNIVRSYLRAAFEFGMKLDHDPVRKAQALRTGNQDAAKLFGIAGNPAAAVPRQAAFDRALDRVLSDAELKKYQEEIVSPDLHPAISCALQSVLLLGGQRLSQLIAVHWSDYDEEDGTLRLIDTKGRAAKREHILPVSERVAGLLRRLRELAGGPDGFIYSTDGGRSRIHESTLSAHSAAIGRKVSDSGIEPFTAADIRRTVETRLAALGVAREHRAQLLSHGRSQGVQAKHYDRHDYLPEKAAALMKWEALLDQIAKAEPAKVVRGRFRRSAAR